MLSKRLGYMDGLTLIFEDTRACNEHEGGICAYGGPINIGISIHDVQGTTRRKTSDTFREKVNKCGSSAHWQQVHVKSRRI